MADHILSEPGTVQADLEAYTRACIRYGMKTGVEERIAALEALRAAMALTLRSADGDAWKGMELLWELTAAKAEESAS